MDINKINTGIRRSVKNHKVALQKLAIYNARIKENNLNDINHINTGIRRSVKNHKIALKKFVIYNANIEWSLYLEEEKRKKAKEARRIRRIIVDRIRWKKTLKVKKFKPSCK